MLYKSFVLSGGGVRGAAHLGAIKALNESGIYPSAYSGTSAGAIVAAFLAAGYTPEEVLALFMQQLNFRMLSWNSFKMGLVSLKKIESFLEKHLRYTLIEELPIPLFISATNFKDGSQMIFDKGNLVSALIAASSIPGIFPPKIIAGIPYVDGGLSNNLPIEPFASHKGDIISIYVNPIKDFHEDMGVMKATDRALHLSFRANVRRSAADNWLYIEPLDLANFGLFEISKLQEIYAIGYQATKQIVQEGGMINPIT